MWVQAPRTMLLHARGIEHHTKGVDNVLVVHQPRARDRQDRQAGLRLRDDHRPGQRAGRRASTASAATSSPARATSRTPSTARTSPSAGACRRRRLPGKGATAPEIVEMIHRGEIRGLLSLCFNPLVSLPDAAFTRAALERLDFYVADRLLPVRDRAPRRSDPARLAAGGGRGHGHQRRGPRDPHPQGGRAAGRGAPRLADHLRSRAPARRTASASTSPAPARDLRRAAPRLDGRHRRLLRHHLGEDRAADGRLLAVPDEDHPGTPRLFEGGRFAHPDGRARFHADRVPAAGRGRRRRVPDHPHHRARRVAVPLAARRRGASARSWRTSTRSRGSRCIRASPTRLGIARRRARARRRAGAGRSSSRRTSSRPSGPTPSSSRTTGPATQSANRLTRARLRSDRRRSPSSRWPRCASSGCDAQEVRMIQELFIDAEPLHRLPRLRGGVQRVSGPRRSVDDPPRLPRARDVGADARRRSACTAPSRPAPRVCPADAIKVDAEGVVLSAMAERCIGCGNCALACPFGVPQHPTSSSS